LGKDFVCRPEIGEKYFDKLMPEPGPTRLTLWFTEYSRINALWSALKYLKSASSWSEENPSRHSVHLGWSAAQNQT